MNKFKAYYLVFIISLFSVLKAENDYYYFYNLNAGANLLSFPLETENNEIELFFNDDNPDLISNYDIPSSLISVISEGEISLCQTGIGGSYVCVGSLDEISADKGYWIILEEPLSFLYNGDTIINESYFLHPGSNLISFPYSTEQSIYDILPISTQDALTAIIGQNESLLIYNDQFYGSLSIFKPGKGYWFIANDYSIFQYLSPIENNSTNFESKVFDYEDEAINQSILQSIYFVESIFISGNENLEELSLNIYCDDTIVGQKNWENKFSDLIAMGNDGYEWTTGYCDVNQLVKIKNNSNEELYVIRGDNEWVPNNYSIVTLSNANLGDLNFDQTINIGDIVIMIEHITEINIIDNLHKSLLADINLDEIINITDIIINIEHILNN